MERKEHLWLIFAAIVCLGCIVVPFGFLLFQFLSMFSALEPSLSAFNEILQYGLRELLGPVIITLSYAFVAFIGLLFVFAIGGFSFRATFALPSILANAEERLKYLSWFSGITVSCISALFLFFTIVWTREAYDLDDLLYRTPPKSELDIFNLQFTGPLVLAALLGYTVGSRMLMWARKEPIILERTRRLIVISFALAIWIMLSLTLEIHLTHYLEAFLHLLALDVLLGVFLLAVFEPFVQGNVEETQEVVGHPPAGESKTRRVFFNLILAVFVSLVLLAMAWLFFAFISLIEYFLDSAY